MFQSLLCPSESYLNSGVILFQQAWCHFLHCFLDSCYFSCQTNPSVVSPPAHGCSRPHTRLHSHSPQQTSCRFVFLRHPVLFLISSIFCFPTVYPITPPPQSYCHFYLFINTVLFPPQSPVLCFSLYCLGESLREGQGQTTGWAGSLPVAVMVELVFLLGYSCRYDPMWVF